MPLIHLKLRVRCWYILVFDWKPSNIWGDSHSCVFITEGKGQSAALCRELQLFQSFLKTSVGGEKTNMKDIFCGYSNLKLQPFQGLVSKESLLKALLDENNIDRAVSMLLTLFDINAQGITFSYLNWGFEEIYKALSANRMGAFYEAPRDVYAQVFAIHWAQAIGYVIQNAPNQHLKDSLNCLNPRERDKFLKLQTAIMANLGVEDSLGVLRKLAHFIGIFSEYLVPKLSYFTFLRVNAEGYRRAVQAVEQALKIQGDNVQQLFGKAEIRQKHMLDSILKFTNCTPTREIEMNISLIPSRTKPNSFRLGSLCERASMHYTLDIFLYYNPVITMSELVSNSSYIQGAVQTLETLKSSIKDSPRKRRSTVLAGNLLVDKQKPDLLKSKQGQNSEGDISSDGSKQSSLASGDNQPPDSQILSPENSKSSEEGQPSGLVQDGADDTSGQSVSLTQSNTRRSKSVDSQKSVMGSQHDGHASDRVLKDLHEFAKNWTSTYNRNLKQMSPFMANVMSQLSYPKRVGNFANVYTLQQNVESFHLQDNGNSTLLIDKDVLSSTKAGGKHVEFNIGDFGSSVEKNAQAPLQSPKSPSWDRSEHHRGSSSGDGPGDGNVDDGPSDGERGRGPSRGQGGGNHPPSPPGSPSPPPYNRGRRGDKADHYVRQLLRLYNYFHSTEIKSVARLSSLIDESKDCIKGLLQARDSGAVLMIDIKGVRSQACEVAYDLRGDMEEARERLRNYKDEVKDIRKEKRKLAGENLEGEKIPPLVFVSGKKTNLYEWYKVLRSKHSSIVATNDSSLLRKLVETVYQSLPKSVTRNFSKPQDLSEIFNYLRKTILGSREGMLILLPVNFMARTPCLTFSRSLERLTAFLQNSEVVLSFRLHQFIELNDIQQMANYLLPFSMLERWQKHRAKLNKGGIVNTKLIDDLQSTIAKVKKGKSDDLSLDFDSSDEDDLNQSMNAYETLRSRSGEKAEALFLEFFNFLFDCHAEIEELAFAESNNPEMMKATLHANKLHKNYKEKSQVQESKQNVGLVKSTFVNSITKAQRAALGAKGSIYKVNCPCQDQSCLALWLCPKFRAMSLSDKNQVVSENKACKKCLSRHTGDKCAKYSGKHVCKIPNCQVSPFLCKDKNKQSNATISNFSADVGAPLVGKGKESTFDKKAKIGLGGSKAKIGLVNSAYSEPLANVEFDQSEENTEDENDLMSLYNHIVSETYDKDGEGEEGSSETEDADGSSGESYELYDNIDELEVEAIGILTFGKNNDVYYANEDGLSLLLKSFQEGDEELLLEPHEEDMFSDYDYDNSGYDNSGYDNSGYDNSGYGKDIVPFGRGNLPPRGTFYRRETPRFHDPQGGKGRWSRGRPRVRGQRGASHRGFYGTSWGRRQGQYHEYPQYSQHGQYSQPGPLVNPPPLSYRKIKKRVPKDEETGEDTPKRLVREISPANSIMIVGEVSGKAEKKEILNTDKNKKESESNVDEDVSQAAQGEGPGEDVSQAAQGEGPGEENGIPDQSAGGGDANYEQGEGVPGENQHTVPTQPVERGSSGVLPLPQEKAQSWGERSQCATCNAMSFPPQRVIIELVVRTGHGERQINLESGTNVPIMVEVPQMDVPVEAPNFNNYYVGQPEFHGHGEIVLEAEGGPRGVSSPRSSYLDADQNSNNSSSTVAIDPPETPDFRDLTTPPVEELGMKDLGAKRKDRRFMPNYYYENKLIFALSDEEEPPEDKGKKLKRKEKAMEMKGDTYASCLTNKNYVFNQGEAISREKDTEIDEETFVTDMYRNNNICSYGNDQNEPIVDDMYSTICSYHNGQNEINMYKHEPCPVENGKWSLEEHFFQLDPETLVEMAETLSLWENYEAGFFKCSDTSSLTDDSSDHSYQEEDDNESEGNESDDASKDNNYDDEDNVGGDSHEDDHYSGEDSYDDDDVESEGELGEAEDACLDEYNMDTYKSCHYLLRVCLILLMGAFQELGFNNYTCDSFDWYENILMEKGMGVWKRSNKVIDKGIFDRSTLMAIQMDDDVLINDDSETWVITNRNGNKRTDQGYISNVKGFPSDNCAQQYGVVSEGNVSCGGGPSVHRGFCNMVSSKPHVNIFGMQDQVGVSKENRDLSSYPDSRGLSLCTDTSLRWKMVENLSKDTPDVFTEDGSTDASVIMNGINLVRKVTYGEECIIEPTKDKRWNFLAKKAIRFNQALEGTGISDTLGIQSCDFFPFLRESVDMDGLVSSGYSFYQKKEIDAGGKIRDMVYIKMHWLYDSAASNALVHRDLFDKFLIPTSYKPVAFYGPFTTLAKDVDCNGGSVRKGDKIEARKHPHIGTWLPKGGYLEVALGGSFVTFRKDLHQRKIIIDNFAIHPEMYDKFSLEEENFSGRNVDLLIPLGFRVVKDVTYAEAGIYPHELFPKLFLCRSVFDDRLIFYGSFGMNPGDLMGPLHCRPNFILPRVHMERAMKTDFARVDSTTVLSDLYSRLNMHEKTLHEGQSRVAGLIKGLAERYGFKLRLSEKRAPSSACEVKMKARGCSGIKDTLLIKRAGIRSIPADLCDFQMQSLVMVSQTLLSMKRGFQRIPEF